MVEQARESSEVVVAGDRLTAIIRTYQEVQLTGPAGVVEAATRRLVDVTALTPAGERVPYLPFRANPPEETPAVPDVRAMALPARKSYDTRQTPADPRPRDQFGRFLPEK